jgi:uncharacterized LabA/DUF88 family protein
MRTSIYIDGFNLYYLAVKGTPYKWLDLKAVFAALLQPHHRITALKYFTALVSGKRDPQQPIRQQTYWRALRVTTPELTIYRGSFLTHPVKMPLAQPSGNQKYATVLKTEEKGSDVNLAVHLLNDAWLDAYDCAVIVSNDSDLAEAMRLIKSHHPNKKLGLVFPRHKGHPSRELMQYADFQKHLGEKLLAACQFPTPIPGTTIHKPVTW